MNNPYPHELNLSEVYLAPWLPAVVFAFLLSLVTALILNRLGLARFVYAPAYVFVAMWVCYLILIDRFWIHF